MLPCTEEEVEALFYFISNLYLTLYPIRTLSIPFPNFTAVHGVGVAQAKPACKHTIATRKCYQYNTIYCTLLNVVGYYDLSVLAMSVKGLQKSLDGGGWVGGVSHIQFFFTFLELF